MGIKVPLSWLRSLFQSIVSWYDTLYYFHVTKVASILSEQIRHNYIYSPGNILYILQPVPFVNLINKFLVQSQKCTYRFSNSSPFRKLVPTRIKWKSSQGEFPVPVLNTGPRFCSPGPIPWMRLRQTNIAVYIGIELFKKHCVKDYILMCHLVS